MRKFLPITEYKIKLRYLSPFRIRIFLIAKQSNRAAERVCMMIDFAIKEEESRTFPNIFGNVC
ncbi:hypothetical protein DQX05_29730 [Paenibacillus thiaminolyticus]|uniref:Uncharacterized protein n=1 Tax=Paenibacillus thiaminolyticus TaxID=49283 RepID=A0A3A3GUQ0_PANTH|nr:hypothetical protein DQX05_29730 [Paenibacillus thiaminolyticus]